MTKLIEQFSVGFATRLVTSIAMICLGACGGSGGESPQDPTDPTDPPLAADGGAKRVAAHPS